MRLKRETKKTAAAFVQLPLNTIIDIVAVTKDQTYIFEMSYGDWLRIKKKPGVKYLAFQKGYAAFPGAIRTEYKH